MTEGNEINERLALRAELSDLRFQHNTEEIAVRNLRQYRTHLTRTLLDTAEQLKTLQADVDAASAQLASAHATFLAGVFGVTGGLQE